jgi:hypothetical protein
MRRATTDPVSISSTIGAKTPVSPLACFAHKVEIPLTEVSGSFRFCLSNLHPNRYESHQRQLVDASDLLWGQLN